MGNGMGLWDCGLFPIAPCACPLAHGDPAEASVAGPNFHRPSGVLPYHIKFGGNVFPVFRRASSAFAVSLLVCAAGSVNAQQAKLNKYGYPEKHKPEPTTAAITDKDLMTRLYIFADDSMMGRQVG